MHSRSCGCSVPLESKGLRGEAYLDGLGCPCKSSQDRQQSGKVLAQHRTSEEEESNFTSYVKHYKSRVWKVFPVHILATMNALGNLPAS